MATTWVWWRNDDRTKLSSKLLIWFDFHISFSTKYKANLNYHFSNLKMKILFAGKILDESYRKKIIK